MRGRRGVRHVVGNLPDLRTARLPVPAARRTQARAAPACQLSGRTRQDHGLLRAESGGTGHAPGRGRVATTPDVCARTGGAKYGAEFATRPRGRFTMTRWGRWLFIWWGVVCVLWSLGVHAGVPHAPHAEWDPSVGVGPWSHAVPIFRRVFPSTSPASIRLRAGPLEWSAPSCALVTANDGGPPWLDTRGPPGAGGRPWVSGKAAGHAGSSKDGPRTFPPRNSHASTGPTAKLAFCNSL